jgi:hypothetical protein
MALVPRRHDTTDKTYSAFANSSVEFFSQSSDNYHIIDDPRPSSPLFRMGNPASPLH